MLLAKMQGSAESNTLAHMKDMRLLCEREIPIQKDKIESLHNSYRNVFDSAKSEAQRTIKLQGKLEKVKGELKEAEDALAKSLAVKTRKEAKRMALLESMSVTKARVEELTRIVEGQKGRKDEYASIISQHSESLTNCEAQLNQNREHLEQTEEAISWYNKVLGFRIECGQGVKFIFTNINPKDPNEEFAFVIRYENDVYTLLRCDPHLSHTKELVRELNKTNGLFKFVRIMRRNFVEAAVHRTSAHNSLISQDSSMVSPSAPVAFASTDHTYESPAVEMESQTARPSSNSRRVRKGDNVFSPTTPSSIRRSARLKVKK